MESKHLIIRESTFSDCIKFSEWEQKEYVRDAFTMSSDRGYEEIAQEFAIRTQDRDKMQLTIVDKEMNQPIGRVYISRIDPYYDSLDITRIYIGEEPYLGRGYGEESLRLLLEYSFINLHMERVTLDHLDTNKRAGNLYQRLGFQYEGLARHAGKKEGKYVDLHLMSLLRAEYFEGKDQPL